MKLPKGKPNPCTCLGPDPCTCHGPTAAEVVEACLVALHQVRVYLNTHHVTYLDRTAEADRLRAMKHEAREFVEAGKHVDALALCARWKEENGA